MTALGGGLRRTDGGHHPGDRWLGGLDGCDHRVLDRADGPVLDVGCGPARHTVALAESGVPSLGIDITTCLLDRARRSGAAVLERDVFDRVPAEGRWGTVLLLDGNIGIGGDPVALLTRVTELLRPGGTVLVEVHDDAVAPSGGRDHVRVEVDGDAGPWFGWEWVTVGQVDALLDDIDLVCRDRWVDDDRWFFELVRPADAWRRGRPTGEAAA